MIINSKQKGLSLVELLISILIFGIISSAIMLTMSGSLRTTTVSRNINDMTQSINSIFEIIRRDMELAGNHVMNGIYIPNNTNPLITNGFDPDGCRNNIASNITVRDMSNNPLGVIPAGTDTVAFTFTRSAGDFDLRCSSLSGFIPPVDLEENYSPGNPIIVNNADNFRCFMNENSQKPVFALIMNDQKRSELFTIEDISGNEINIADDDFSDGNLHGNFNSESRVYLLGLSPNAGKIEYFILEWEGVNPRDPDTPLRSLVKRLNNREIYPIADNITDMQIRYILDNGTITDQIGGSDIVASVEITLDIRSDDTILDEYIEQSYSTLIAVKGTMFRETEGRGYYP